MGISRLLGGVAAVAMMVASVTPAQAQRWGHHRHHHGDGTGNFILGALIGGVIVAAASADSKRDRAERETYESPPPPPPPSTAYTPAEPAEPAPSADYGESSADITDADSAANACGEAAESKGLQYARVAHVSSIDLVDPAGSSWRVSGKIEMRNDYRARGTEHGFSCFIAGAGVPSVKIDGYGN